MNAKRIIKSMFRKTQRFFKNRQVQQTLYTSYHIYNTMRYIRNPFLMLEHLNAMNIVRLIER